VTTTIDPNPIYTQLARELLGGAADEPEQPLAGEEETVED
jgi:hypothetical protein